MIRDRGMPFAIPNSAHNNHTLPTRPPHTSPAPHPRAVARNPPARPRPRPNNAASSAARNYGFAESVARSAVEKQPNQVPPLAALVEILHATGKTKEAREAYQKLAPLARSADSDTPVFRRLAPLVAAWKTDKGGSAPSE